MADNTTPWSPLHPQTVDHIETPDMYTVKVYAKDPPYVFYSDAIAGTWIVPKKYFEQVGLDAFKRQPVGSGPWQLSKFTSGASAELEANEHYWGTIPRVGQTGPFAGARAVDRNRDARVQ